MWNALESYICQKFGLGKFNNFSLSQICYGFSKTHHGSSDLWKEIVHTYCERADKLDSTGISIMFNSIGRSQHASIKQVINEYRGIILYKMSDFSIQQFLLILSGVAIEMTSKSKTDLKTEDIISLYTKFVEKFSEND